MALSLAKSLVEWRNVNAVSVSLPTDNHLLVAYLDQVIAKFRSQQGVKEVPLGSNAGPQVHKYQSATGQYNVAWCASFVQWVLKQEGIGPIANDTASAYYLGNYALRHGWQIPKPVPGCIAVYTIGAGHTGFVDKVDPDGSWWGIEGNWSDMVSRVHRTHADSPTLCFFIPPNEKPRPRKVQVPRFEVVSSVKGHAVVTARWGKWSAVGPKVPGILVKYRNAHVLRNMITKPPRHVIGR